MAGETAIARDVSMIEDGDASESFGIMAHPAIFGRFSMSLIIRRCCGVNTSVGIVAGFTRLCQWVKYTVVENTTGHFET